MLVFRNLEEVAGSYVEAKGIREVIFVVYDFLVGDV